MEATTLPTPAPTLTRRQLAKSACAGVAAAAATRLWTPAAAFAQDVDRTLVVVFLRGGMDGLSALVPYGDPRYAGLRPTIGIPADRLLTLDATFGLHPAMAPLLDLYRDGHLALVHSSGSVAESRSHFEQQALMEAGTAAGAVAQTGWLARHLAGLGVTALPMHAMSWGSTTPASLRGDLNALSLSRFNSFRVNTFGRLQDPTAQAMRLLYDGTDEVLGGPGVATLGVMDQIAGLRETLQQTTVEYPGGGFAASLREIAQVIKADTGLAAATVDMGGWDIHADAGPGDADWGAQRGRLAELAGSLRAFADDLGTWMSRTTVVVMSEFGRRAQENASRGTDHGRGNLMMVLGQGVRGGVHGDWRGLGDDALDRGDVPVTTDYRNIVGEVVADLHRATDLGQVFPDHQFSFRNIV